MTGHKPALLAGSADFLSKQPLTISKNGENCEHKCNPDAILIHFGAALLLCLSPLSVPHRANHQRFSSKLHSSSENGQKPELRVEKPVSWLCHP
jgi:hypothetical protein